MRTKDIFKAIACIALSGALFTACEDDEVSVSAVTVLEAKYVDNAMRITLKDNATLQLTPFIMPSNAANKRVTYTNKHADILSVSESGLITPKLGVIGTDTITVSSTDGSGIRTSYTVHIIDHMVKATAINVTAAIANLSLKITAEPFDLKPHITLAPEDTWDTSLGYTSANEEIVTVDANGMVTPTGIGSTTITLSTLDGSNLTRTINVTVLDRVFREIDIDRAPWTVTTSVLYSDGKNYVTDGSTGKPEDMFDGAGNTFLSMVKPGKTYGNYSGKTEGYELYFIVDMQQQHEFNYLMWQHRAGNNYAYLRAWGVTVHGSNDGLTWETIKADELQIPIKGIDRTDPTKLQVNEADTNLYRIDLGLGEGVYVKYRYVKIQITNWSDNSGGATGGSSVQIGEFGLGRSHWE